MNVTNKCWWWIIIVFLVLLAVVFLLQSKNVSKMEKIDYKYAITVLTRGYDTVDEYEKMLIPRNISIYEKIYKGRSDMYEVLIFHEGNIPKDQQDYIQSKTPEMPIKFVDVSNTFIRESDVPKSSEFCQATSLSDRFSTGYKNMCKFWFCDFLDYTKDYKYVIRIDEDCKIEEFPSGDDIFNNGTYKYVTPFFQSGEDDSDVIRGMNQFTRVFLEENDIEWKEIDRMPYTNLFAIDAEYFRNLDILKKYRKRVEDSGCIFVNRWGDMPLWAQIVKNMINENQIHEDKRISYFHGSHGWKINM